VINNLLRDIIETGDIVVFIDDIMIEMETEEEHDDIMDKVLRKMVENDLFMKPEKCV